MDSMLVMELELRELDEDIKLMEEHLKNTKDEDLKYHLEMKIRQFKRRKKMMTRSTTGRYYRLDNIRGR